MVMAMIEWFFQNPVGDFFGIQQNALGQERVVVMDIQGEFTPWSPFSAVPNQTEDLLLSLASHLSLERL